MKLIHCADLHLDSKMKTHLTTEQAAQRRMEILHTFTRMVDYAQDNQVPVILIAGDLFDTRSISATVRNQVRDTILSHPQIDFLYLKGNHDEDNFLSRMEQVPENLLMFDREWCSYDYGRVSVTGIELCEENCSTYASSLVLDTDQFNIVMLHGQLTEYTVTSDPLNISLSSLKNKNIDYLALGHVHEYTFGKLDTRGYYAYPGCLEGRGFDECDEHGFLVIDIDDQTLRPSYSFVPIAYRTLYSIPVNMSGAATTHEAGRRIEETLARGDYPAKSMVRFVLCGDVDVDYEVNTEFLQQQFADAFYYEEVVDRTKLKVSYSDFEKDATLKGEFIRMVLKTGLEENLKNQVIRCGIGALIGEEAGS